MSLEAIESLMNIPATLESAVTATPEAVDTIAEVTKTPVEKLFSDMEVEASPEFNEGLHVIGESAVAHEAMAQTIGGGAIRETAALLGAENTAFLQDSELLVGDVTAELALVDQDLIAATTTFNTNCALISSGQLPQLGPGFELGSIGSPEPNEFTSLYDVMGNTSDALGGEVLETPADLSNLQSANVRPIEDFTVSEPITSIEPDMSPVENFGEGDIGADSKAIEGGIVYSNGEWLVDDIDNATKEALLNGSGEDLKAIADNLLSEYTVAERAAIDDLLKGMLGPEGNSEIAKYVNELQELKAKGVNPEVTDISEKISTAQEDDSEMMKLLLRVAVKVGTKVAATVARNMAKDKDMDPAIRAMLGTFADLTTEGGKFADKFIAGDVNANLEKDLIDFFNKN